MSAIKWISKGLKNLGLGSVTRPSVVPALQSRLPPSPLAGTHALVSIPPKPKRPLSAYFRFLEENRSEVVRNNPSIKATEITKLVAQRWSVLETSAKNKYLERFREEMKSYQTVLDKYTKSLTPEQSQAQEQLVLSKELRQEKREKRKRLMELGKPKKPMTAFLQFLQGKVPAGSSMKEHTTLAQKYGTIWNDKMTDTDKAPYTAKYHKLMGEYEKTLKTWENEMIKLGHEDLVRVVPSTNTKPKPKAPGVVPK